MSKLIPQRCPVCGRPITAADVRWLEGDPPEYFYSPCGCKETSAIPSKEKRTMTTENNQAEERRCWAPAEELRVVEAKGMAPTIEGLAVPYGRLSENLGGFRERVMRGAFDESLKSRDEMRVDVEHDTNKLLARRSKGTAKFTSTGSGVDVSFAVPATTNGKDALEDVRVKNLDGLSVTWKRTGVVDRWLEEDGQTVREIVQAHLTGASLTCNPAYRQTVDTLTLRSLEEHQRGNGREEDADEVAKLRMRLDLAQAECE